MYVNHKLRLIYIRAPKTGSTSLLKLFGECGGGSASDTCFEYLKASGTPCL